MWFIGLLIGLALGTAAGRDLWFIGAIAGALIAHGLSRARPGARDDDLAGRLERLEAEVAALRRELHSQGGTPSHIPPPSAEATAPSLERTAPPPPPTAAPAPVLVAAASPLPEAPRPFRRIESYAPPAFQAPPWAKHLWAMNPLAKVGIILLFFGIASGLRLVADYGLFPVSLRLLISACAGTALIAFGWHKARQVPHRSFGQALQGGGFALLYLVAYFMLQRYALIDQGPAFATFAALGVACVFMAGRQDSPALAVLGLSGAFLAPVLAGGSADSPLPLFIYFTLLNAFILTVDWFRAWRVLNIAGFLFTLAVGMAWAIYSYQPFHYGLTQGFLILFLAAYSAMPVATALWRAPGLSGWRDGTLLFGTPLAGAFLQEQLLAGTPYGLAWSALGGSLWYFALWAMLFRRREAANLTVERSHLAIAVSLLTLAVPLACNGQLTSAFWAAEGAAVLWFGIRQERPLACSCGLLLQLAAGIALLWEWPLLGHSLPVANDVVLGATILAGAGLFSAHQLYLRPLSAPAPFLPWIWALAWWLGAGLNEILTFAPEDWQPACILLFITITALLQEGLSSRWHWPLLRPLLLPLAGSALGLAAAIADRGHPLAGPMLLAAPLALAAHYTLLARHETRGETRMQAWRHLGAWWLVLAALAWELVWQAREWTAQPLLWSSLALIAVMSVGLALPILGRQQGRWPFTVTAGAYIPLGLLLPLVVLLLLLPWSNLHLSGTDGLGWPYLPLLNPFDMLNLGTLAVLLLAARHLAADTALLVRSLSALLAFLWISCLAARIAHHWGGVPFTLEALMGATSFQALLTLFWSLTAIATMIFASRRAWRAAWFAGILLLGLVGAKLLLLDAAGRGTLTWTATLIGVALLLLAAGYFAPLPPAKAEEEPLAGDTLPGR